MAVEIFGIGESVTVSDPSSIVAVRSESPAIDISSSVLVGGIPYRGSYEITPSPDGQVLQTEGRTMTENLVVAPIPENYGLITWNGSFLTVS